MAYQIVLDPRSLVKIKPIIIEVDEDDNQTVVSHGVPVDITLEDLSSWLSSEAPAPAVAWDEVEDKPAVIAAGVDQAAARTAIGLGSLATLSTITSANITDGTITNADISASAAIALSKLANVAAYAAGGITAGTLQDTLNALADRITALETP